MGAKASVKSSGNLGMCLDPQKAWTTMEMGITAFHSPCSNCVFLQHMSKSGCFLKQPIWWVVWANFTNGLVIGHWESLPDLGEYGIWIFKQLQLQNTCRDFCWCSYSTLNMLIQHPNLWKTNSLLLKMAIEIVSFPMNNGDFPISFVNVYQRVDHHRHHLHRLHTSFSCLLELQMWMPSWFNKNVLNLGFWTWTWGTPQKNSPVKFTIHFPNGTEVCLDVGTQGIGNFSLLIFDQHHAGQFMPSPHLPGQVTHGQFGISRISIENQGNHWLFYMILYDFSS